MKEQLGRVIALGFFDGVHLGHASLLEMAKQRAKALGLRPAVISFDLHPDNLVAGHRVQLINSIQDRKEVLQRVYGIEDVILVHFDESMMHMAWDAFVEDVLVREYGARHLVCGYDFRFGDRGAGNPQRLQEKCRELGIGCDVMPRFSLDGITVSSTYIRALLEPVSYTHLDVYKRQPRDGQKEFVGTLTAYDAGTVTLETGQETVEFTAQETAQVRLYVEF